MNATAVKTWTVQQAREQLTALGFSFDTSRMIWVNNDGDGGRLEWVPDYNNPAATTSGTSFYLRRPSVIGTGTIAVPMS